MNDDQAAKFIERMFSYAARDHVAVLAVPRSGGRTEQRVFTLPQATSRKAQGRQRHLNGRDYDIYLSVNLVWPGSRGREKIDIEEMRRLQLGLDEDGRKTYARVFQDVERGALPCSSHILRSSKDRYQVLWDAVPGRWGHQQAEAVTRGLADRCGGDRAAPTFPGSYGCRDLETASLAAIAHWPPGSGMRVRW